VIVESIKNLKDREGLQPAAFLSETTAVAFLEKSRRDSNKRVKRLRARLSKVLANPTKVDPVYKVVQRLFTNKSLLNLNRESTERRRLKRAAFRRYILGYPPRKPNDTSMGDALNWEWILHVASETRKHVAIVSRDSDYGVEFEGESHMNDFLVQEFRDRVSKKRNCKLFNRLTPALKFAGITVPRGEEKDEAEFAKAQSVFGQAHFMPVLSTLPGTSQSVVVSALPGNLASGSVTFRELSLGDDFADWLKNFSPGQRATFPEASPEEEDPEEKA
jgi:PIN domain